MATKTRAIAEGEVGNSALGGSDLPADLARELLFDYQIRAILEIGLTPVTLALTDAGWTDLANWDSEELASNCTTDIATGSIVIPVDCWVEANFTGTVENKGVSPVDLIAEPYVFRPGVGAVQTTKGPKGNQPVQATTRHYSAPIQVEAGDHVRWRFQLDSGTANVDFYRCHFWLDRFD